MGYNTMKKEDKVNRLKERKRAREKRQRWRRREAKRLARAMANGVPSLIVLPSLPGRDLDRMRQAMGSEAEEKMGELAIPMVTDEGVPPPIGVWGPAWWLRLPKILRAVTWPAVWVHVRYLKWRYPPSYISSEGESE